MLTENSDLTNLINLICHFIYWLTSHRTQQSQDLGDISNIRNTVIMEALDEDLSSKPATFVIQELDLSA